MRHLVVAAVLGALGPAQPAAAGAQAIAIPPNIERLADRAVDSVNVTVDGALLQLAARFLSSDDPEQRAVKELIGGLEGIYVRRFTFAEAGEYSEADVESLRGQLRAPDWSKMVSVRSRNAGEDVDVYLRLEQQQIAGLVVMAAAPRELTFVHIVGPIDLEQLAALGGQFGIPRLDLESAGQ